MPPSLKSTCPFPTISTEEADEVVTKGSDAHRATRALVRARETLSAQLLDADGASLDQVTAFASAWVRDYSCDSPSCSPEHLPGRVD